MTTLNELRKEMNTMVSKANKTRLKEHGVFFTAAIGKMNNGKASFGVIILKGKKKLQPKRGGFLKESYNHYEAHDDHIMSVGIDQFEKMFLRTIKAGCYIYIKMWSKTSKSKKPKEL